MKVLFDQGTPVPIRRGQQGPDLTLPPSDSLARLDQTSAGLARLAADAVLRASTPHASHARSHKRCGLLTQARRVEAIYDEILGGDARR